MRGLADRNPRLGLAELGRSTSFATNFFAAGFGDFVRASIEEGRRLAWPGSCAGEGGRRLTFAGEGGRKCA